MPALFRWLFFGCLTRIAATFATLVAIFLIAEAFDKARYIGHGLTATLLVEYLMLKIPFMISEFMPIVVLLGASFQLVELARHQELVAMRAAGLGVSKVVVPLLMASSLVAIATFTISEWVTPETNQQLDKIERVNIHHLPDNSDDVQWLKDGQRFFRLQALGGSNFRLVMLQTDAEGHWLERIEAARARYENGVWQLDNVYISKPAGDNLSLSEQDHMQLPSAAGPDTADPPDPRHMRLVELAQYANSLERAGLAASSFRFTLHRKLSVPLSCVIMALLAIALCMNMGGRFGSVTWGVVGAITLGLLSYVMGTATQLLTMANDLPAAFAAWLPDLLTLGLGGFLLLHREGY